MALAAVQVGVGMVVMGSDGVVELVGRGGREGALLLMVVGTAKD
jgi:hypothetical protein